MVVKPDIVLFDKSVTIKIRGIIIDINVSTFSKQSKLTFIFHYLEGRITTAHNKDFLKMSKFLSSFSKAVKTIGSAYAIYGDSTNSVISLV